jgi:hypothetical protein
LNPELKLNIASEHPTQSAACIDSQGSPGKFAAGKGEAIFSSSHLRGPLALRFAPNGHLLAANGDTVNADVLHPSEIVEFTRWGEFIREYDVDASQGGAFGLDTRSGEDGELNYAVIDDVTNSLLVTRESVH